MDIWRVADRQAQGDDFNVLKCECGMNVSLVQEGEIGEKSRWMCDHLHLLARSLTDTSEWKMLPPAQWLKFPHLDREV